MNFYIEKKKINKLSCSFSIFKCTLFCINILKFYIETKNNNKNKLNNIYIILEQKNKEIIIHTYIR